MALMVLVEIGVDAVFHHKRRLIALLLSLRAWLALGLNLSALYSSEHVASYHWAVKPNLGRSQESKTITRSVNLALRSRTGYWFGSKLSKKLTLSLGGEDGIWSWHFAQLVR
jgi:hypothetical protein